MAEPVPATTGAGIEALVPLLQAHGGSEFINSEGRFKARDFVTALAHNEDIAPELVAWMEANKAPYVNAEARAYYAAKPKYTLLKNRGRTGNNNNNDDGGQGSRGPTRTDPRRNEAMAFDLKSIYVKGQAALSLNDDGTPKAPTQFGNIRLAGGVTIASGARELPETLLTDSFFRCVDSIAGINGSDCFDAENFALGVIEEKEYFLFPSTVPYEPCDINVVCCNWNKNSPNMLILAMVYTLNKNQALANGWTAQEAIKWGAIRAQAYVAGWFAGQKYTKYVEPPEDSVTVFEKDEVENPQFFAASWALVGFIPFVHELSFRQTGSTWTQSTSADYERKLGTLAASAGVTDHLTYLEAAKLHKSALRWIGVRRVMEVLKRRENLGAIHRIFQIRAVACPAGQAVLNTANSVINSLKRAGAWSQILQAARWDDAPLYQMLDIVQKNPFKWHLLPEVYGETPPTADEKADNKRAIERAELFAPILHAYSVINSPNDPISRNKVLAKHAKNAGALFERYKKFFRYCKQRPAETIGECFNADVFGIQAATREEAARNNPRNRGRYFDTGRRPRDEGYASDGEDYIPFRRRRF